MFGRKKQVSDARVTAEEAATESAAPSSTGPHDRSSVADVRQYYVDLGYGHIDLGALVIGVPPGRDLNVALDPNGLPEFHVVTPVSRVIPRAFAAPKTAGQWRTMVAEMSAQLEQQGAEVSIEDGPWGRELVAVLPGAVFRAIGVDGNRWTAEVRIMATPELAEQAAAEGREVFEHLLVDRGDGPMPAREQLPLTIPDEIQQALDKARSQMAAQQQAQAYQQQMAAGRTSGAGAQTAGGPARPQSNPAQPQNAPAQPGDQEAPPRSGSAMDRLRGADEL